MYKGGFVTITREIPGYIGMFATYEGLKSYFITNNKDHKFTNLANCISGSLAGVMC